MRIVIITLLLFSCQKKLKPEDALNSFINLRFQKHQSKAAILDLLDEPLRGQVENMDSDAFNQFCPGKPKACARKK